MHLKFTNLKITNLDTLKETLPLFCLLTETEIEHHPCAGESEGEGKPNAGQAPVENETEQIACR